MTESSRSRTSESAPRLKHLPSIFSDAPVVGVPLVTEIQTHPSATGTQQIMVLESAVRFCIEVATSFGNGAWADTTMGH